MTRNRKLAIVPGSARLTIEQPLRWRAVIDFRNGSRTVATIEEIEELHPIVERGPDWNTIDKIVITLNRRSDDSDDPDAA
jgi:hypothetical protein